ncbi:MAG TPA: hypothetical protein VMT53_00935 [Terriglobales bacterium]|nr:hypothetical protein [Terriglobales bacterium]
MRRISLLVLFLLCASLAFGQATRAELIPAGTLLQCTVSEPNFSSKTVALGDPVLCHLGSFAAFGQPLFPRGAELSGRVQEYKDPGHFFGKGWLDLQFDRLILPGAEILPLSAKVISAPRLRVDKEGKIHGKGHPKRDALGWMLPVLWPVKVLTLPARGPYPALKGESRISLRLLEDVQVQLPVTARASVGALNWNLSNGKPVSPLVVPASDNYLGRGLTVPSPRYASVSSHDEAADASKNQLTLIVLKGGAAYIARQYWVEGAQMHCIGDSGEEKLFALEKIDLDQTVRLNRERKIQFVVQSRELVEQ